MRVLSFFVPLPLIVPLRRPFVAFSNPPSLFSSRRRRASCSFSTSPSALAALSPPLASSPSPSTDSQARHRRTKRVGPRVRCPRRRVSSQHSRQLAAAVSKASATSSHVQLVLHDVGCPRSTQPASRQLSIAFDRLASPPSLLSTRQASCSLSMSPSALVTLSPLSPALHRRDTSTRCPRRRVPSQHPVRRFASSPSPSTDSPARLRRF